MPKSKRAKVVHLTKVKKKTREWKEGLVQQVHNQLDDFPTLYVFRYENMRNDKFKELREELKGQGRFILGSNKVLRVALGKSDDDEYKDGLHNLGDCIRGSVGLFATKLSRAEVDKLFEEFTFEDFARSGSKAAETFSLSEGPLEGPAGPIPHTMEPHLRQNGLPTRLNKGVVELVADHVVCREGDTLTPQQAALLRSFGQKQSAFRMLPVAVWENGETDIIDQEYLDSFADKGMAVGFEGLELPPMEINEVDDSEEEEAEGEEGEEEDE